MPDQLTEARVLELLREKHAKPGNGGSGEYIFLTHVRNRTGFAADREFDAITMNLWPSRGLSIHVYEVKVSRTDWQKELSDPAKADAACKLGEQFSVVAPVGVVRDGELPPMWGLLEVRGDGTEDKPWVLRTKKKAPWLRDVSKINIEPLSRSFAVAMLRAAPGAVPGGRVPSPADKALHAEYQRGYEMGKKAGQADAERGRDTQARVAKSFVAFQDALRVAGAEIMYTNANSLIENAPQIAQAINSEVRSARLDNSLDHLKRQLEAVAKRIDEYQNVNETAVRNG